MKKLRVIVTLFCAAIPVLCQTYTPCQEAIADEAGVLRTGRQELTTAMQQLAGAGADVKILTTELFDTSTLRSSVEARIRQCPEWRTGPEIKNNLLVLAVAPKARKMAIFFGPELATALDSEYERLKSQYMAPAFQAGDWSGGFIAVQEQILSILVQEQVLSVLRQRKALLSAQRPPSVSTQAATPSSDPGFPPVVFIAGFAVVLVAAVLVTLHLVQKREEAREEATMLRNKRRATETQDECEKCSEPREGVYCPNCGRRRMEDPRSGSPQTATSANDTPKAAQQEQHTVSQSTNAINSDSRTTDFLSGAVTGALLFGGDHYDRTFNSPSSSWPSSTDWSGSAGSSSPDSGGDSGGGNSSMGGGESSF